MNGTTTTDDGTSARTPAPAAGAVDDALSTVRTLAESRERASRRPGRGDRGSGVLLGAGVLLVSVVFAALAPHPTGRQVLVTLLLLPVFVVANRTEIVLPGGSAVPTQPVIVGLLLVAEPGWTPWVVLVGLHLSDGALLVDRSTPRAERLLGFVVRSSAAWSAVAPAAVLWAVHPGPVSAATLPVYAAAFAAQVVLDGTVALVRAATLEVSPRLVLPGLLWTFVVDALLASVAVCVVVAADGGIAPLVVLAAPTALVRLMAQDRTRQLDTAVRLGAAFDAVHEQARIDPLTGLANRLAWTEALEDLTRTGRPVGVLMADVDGLKRINDNHGHDAGDELLAAVAGVIAVAAARLPAGSTAYRLGGDEFAVLVPCETAADAAALGDRVPAKVRAGLAAHPGVRGAALSCSSGWAASPPEADVAAAVTAADALAAEDKEHRRAGRDHVVPVPRSQRDRRQATERRA